MGVIYSRIYVGRHSIDQCINGLALGLISASCAHNYWRKYIFNKSLNPEYTKRQNWNQVFYAVIAYASILLLAHALFFYVEHKVEIPKQWYDHANLICPNIRIVNMFHYNTIAGVGYCIYPLCFYIFKAVHCQFDVPLRFTFDEGDEESCASWMEVCVRLILPFSIDHLCTVFLPTAIYGTRNLEMY